MTIHVTYDDIRQGRDPACTWCPLQIALKRATGHHWLVGHTVAWHNNPQVLVQLPEEAVQWVQRFDAGRRVAPFSFEIPDL